MNHLKDLNPKQLEAATTLDGPLLIIAGAGAGKTKTIIARIMNLIAELVPRESILAVTFTNKAAKEMRERLLASLKTDQYDAENMSEPFISTFHALCVYILRRHASQLGYNRFFNVLDRDESIAQIKEAMKRSGIDPKQVEPRKILNAISREKGRGINQPTYANQTTSSHLHQIVSQVWEKYETQLRQSNALDFDDLLLKTLFLFRTAPEILKEYQNRWRYIHIDEYQDTNGIQYLISKLLASEHKNICIVGDIDQSIYSWRGADFNNLLTFEDDYPNTKTILLEENYRSTQTILNAANLIIQKNKKRREKNLFTKNEDGEAISVYAGLDETSEANFIAQTAGQQIRAGQPADNMAVLYRANFQSRALEEAFIRHNIPYQVLGVRFFERKEIKDVLAYIKTALNSDDWENFKRISNVPKRGIGKASLIKIASGQEVELSLKLQQKLKSLRELLQLIKHKVETNSETVSGLIKLIIEQSGLLAELQTGTEEDKERLENIKELVTLASKYDALPLDEGVMKLITEATLVSDQDNIADETKAVRLMTVHASKGLEFDVVFIAGLEDRLFPHEPAFLEKDHDEEEERRLFYVALTRARKKLFLTYAQIRTIYGSKQLNLPSPFLLDLPDELLKMENNNGGENLITNKNTDWSYEFN